ncbi:MAG: anti-sigma factor antagonist [Ruminococcus sp.]|nr:anti-sigma factor antagonist [Ruminococcus sp.]
MAVKIYTAQEGLIAVLDGEIDHHCAQDLREKIDQAIMENQPELLILDFQQVTFMDSSGIGLIMGRYKQMCTYSGNVIIRNPPLHIKRVMKLSGIERIAKIETIKI